MQCPYVVVGDEAFPLTTYLMKPFPGKNLSDEKLIFNYRLSRARRTSENAFGILTSRFQIYKKAMYTSPETVNTIIFATVVLHNYLRTHTLRKGLASQSTNAKISNMLDFSLLQLLGKEPAVMQRRCGRSFYTILTMREVYIGKLKWQISIKGLCLKLNIPFMYPRYIRIYELYL